MIKKLRTIPLSTFIYIINMKKKIILLLYNDNL